MDGGVSTRGLVILMSRKYDNRALYVLISGTIVLLLSTIYRLLHSMKW